MCASLYKNSVCAMASTVGTKRFWTEFISLYKSLPEVWNITSDRYKDRILKARAYDKLAAKLQEIDEEADRDAVIKKINTLRGNYRRELKKLRQSEKSGEPYESSLWYFDQLDFLRYMKSPKQAEEVPTFDYVDSNTQMDSFSTSNANNVESSKPKRRKIDVKEPHFENVQHKDSNLKFLETAVKIIRGTRDDAEIYANVWAVEFRKLDNLQKLHAKRSIDEILYQGRFGNLTSQTAQAITAEKDEYLHKRKIDKEVVIEEVEQVEEDSNGVEFEEEEMLEYDEGKPIIISTPIPFASEPKQSRHCQSKYRKD